MSLLSALIMCSEFFSMYKVSMTTLLMRTLVATLIFLSSWVSAAPQVVYRLGAGDLVSIQVYGEPELSLDLRVGMSGTISYPFLGEIQVSGIPPEGLETIIRESLKGPYLVDPSVVVSILEYRPFYVNGEVEKPGSYEYYPGMTVERAISIAGGFTDRASRTKIYVAHDEAFDDDAAGSTSKDGDDLGSKVELSDYVLPGDVITIKQSFF